MKRLGMMVCWILASTGPGLASWAAAPILTVPRAQHPPTIDGVLSPDEWDGATAVSGLLSQLDGVAHPRQATFWLMFDDEHLYVAQRSTVFPEERETRVPQTWLNRDSSFVIALNPARMGRGDTPSHFLLRRNITGQLWTREIFWKIKGVRLTYPHPAWPVDPTVEQTIQDGVWTSEMAIPLAALKAEDLEDGETWGLLLGRDYSAADQNAIVVSSDWRFGDGRRHYGRAFYNHYRLENEYARATLQAGAPAVQVLDLGDLAAGDLKPRLAVMNTGEADLTVTLRLEVRDAAGDTAHTAPQSLSLQLKPGDRLERTFEAVSLPADQTRLCVLSATGEDAAVFFSQTIPVRPDFQADRVAPVPEIYFSGSHFGGRSDVLLPTGYDPILNRFYARLRLGALPDAHLAERVELTVRREGERDPVATLRPRAVTTPEIQLAFHDQSFGTRPATVLEWVSPEDGTVTIEMEGAHWYDPTPNTDGTAMQVLHVSGGESRVLVPRRVFLKSKVWKPIAARDVPVKAGDKIHFYYDKNQHEGCDDFRLRGTLTHTGVATRIFNPAGELTDRQGGSSGVWFYRYDTDATPNPDGVYPELTWETNRHWFNQVGWMKFWDRDPKRHMAQIRRVVTGGDEMVVEDALPELAPGVYEATASVYTDDGRLLGRARQTFIRYDHEKDMPWIGNTLGISDRVLSPWTPITSEGATVSCWGRDYTLHGGGLFTGVRALSESGLARGRRELLAAPVRIEAVREGVATAFTPNETPVAARLSATGHQAHWTGSQSADGWTARATSSMDFDGYVETTLTLAPPETMARVDALRLVIPLKAEFATHLHAAAGEWFRSSVSSITLGTQEGVLWHSGQNHGGGTRPHGDGFGRLMTAGNFKPYVWIGGVHRGLAFMADSDAGWVPDETKQTPAIEVVRAGNQVSLVLNLVARPFAFDKAREITFSLQATPIRPQPDDFRHRRRRYAMGSAFTGGLRDGWTWCGGMFWVDDGKGGRQKLFGHPASPPYRVNWDIAEWYQKQSNQGTFHHGDWINTPYQSLQNVHNFPEADDPRMPPGKQAGDVYGYIFPHMSHGHLEHGNPIIARPDLEYRLWCYDTWIRNVGLIGIYFDQTEPVLTANPNAGFGYVMDLHDRPALHGKVQPGYGVTRTREIYRRLWTLFVEHGVEEPFIWIHSTDANMVGAFAFTDTLLEGENMPRLSEQHPWITDKIPAERMQAFHNSPGKWGLNMTQLPMIDTTVYHSAHPMHEAIYRCWQGWYMLHDVEPHEQNLPWKMLDLKRPAVFLPYWDPAVKAALTPGDEDALASAFRQDGALVVVVFNVAAEDKPAVTLNAVPEALGAGSGEAGTYAVADAESGETLEAAADERGISVTLSIKARDYRIIRIEAR